LFKNFREDYFRRKETELINEFFEKIATNTKKLYYRRINIYKNADIIINTKTLGKQAIAEYVIKNIEDTNLHK
jgi:shikimate kinase